MDSDRRRTDFAGHAHADRPHAGLMLSDTCAPAGGTPALRGQRQGPRTYAALFLSEIHDLHRADSGISDSAGPVRQDAE